MKKLAFLFAVLLALSVFVDCAFAGGGKNRGSKGKGNVNQHQVRNN